MCVLLDFAGPEGYNEVMTSVYEMMRDGTLQLPIEAIYSFADFKAALEHDKRPRMGKILLKP